MFERFTTAARDAVVQAQTEAQDLADDHVGSEHLLLGVLWHGDGPMKSLLVRQGLTYRSTRDRVEAGLHGDYADAEALQHFGIDLDEIRRRVERNFGAGALDRRSSGRVRHLRFSPATKKALELSLREAISLRHNYIGTEHVLLGLTRLNHGQVGNLIRAAGLQPDVLHDQIRDLFRKAA